MAATAALAIAVPVSTAGAAPFTPKLPAFSNSLCPTIPGFLNIGPTGPMGPLGAYGPLGNSNSLPTGCASYNLGPSGPLGPGGPLAGKVGG
jgi:hypothetical protein